MNTHKTALTAKARQLCFLLLLCMHLAWGGVPGPCRHSVTKDHLQSLNRLIDNQLDNGCSIIYPFTERRSLSKVCYVKAAFPQILELLNAHFQYARKSDNRRYISTLKKVIYNLYSQGCMPEINEEIEDTPVRFVKVQHGSPKEALRKVKAVIQMYMSLMTESSGPVDWSCQAEYTEEDAPESTPAFSVTTGGPECPCSCPTFSLSNVVSMSSLGLRRGQVPSTHNQPKTTVPTGSLRPPPGTVTYNTVVSLGSLGETGRLPAVHLMTGTVSYRSPLKDDTGVSGVSWWSPAPIKTGRGPQLFKAELDTPPVFAHDPAGLARPDSVSVGPPNFVDKTVGVREALTYSSARSRIEGSPREHFSVVDTVTPASYLYDAVGLTPSSGESAARVLAKRSLDTQNFGILHNSHPDTGLQRAGTASPGPEVEVTEARTRVPETTIDGVEKFSTGPDALQTTERHLLNLKRVSRDLQNQAEDLRTPTTEEENISRVNKDTMRTEESPTFDVWVQQFHPKGNTVAPTGGMMV